MALQKDIAEKLGITSQAVSQLIQRWGISVQELSLDDAIRLMWKQMSESAAGRQGDLAAARSKTEELKQQMLSLQIAEKSRQLVSAEEFKQALLPTIKAIRTIFTGMPARIVQQAKTLAGVDLEIEFIEEIVNDGLRSCTEIEVRRIVDAVVRPVAGIDTPGTDDDNTMGDLVSEDE